MRVLAVAALALTIACGGGDASPATVYQRLGDEPGIARVVDDLLARVSADPAINGYFLNRSVDRGHLAGCLVRQLAHAAGGPQTYPDPDGTPHGCRDMTAAHHGHRISGRDLDDFLGHLRAALTAGGASEADTAALLAALAPSSAVEDATSDATVYQRVGRRPGLDRIVTAFEARVDADARIRGFFATIKDHTRIHTCLARFLCAVDGPCRYGEEVDGEPGVSTDLPCRPMAASHRGLRDDHDQPIGLAHFDAVLELMTATLTAAAVSPADRTLLLDALAPTCPEIVADDTCAP
jgi:hemoglobin